MQVITRSDEQEEDDVVDENVARDETSTVTVVGLVSKPVYGSGRTSSDRQFFYINGRPWEAGRVSRAFNEVYKSFNSNHFPFVIADFRLPTDSYDVNVSPDKRTIFLHEESRLIEKVKEALEELFAPSRATFLVNGASHSLRSGSGGSVLPVQSKLGRFTSSTAEARTADEDEEEEDAEEENQEFEQREADVHDAVSEAQEKDQMEPEDTDEEEGKDRPNPMMHDLAPPPHDLEYREESDPLLPASLLHRTDVREDDNDSEPEVLAPLASEPGSPPPASSKRAFEEVLDTSQASWSPTKKQRTAPSSPAPIRSSHASPSAGRSRKEVKNVLGSLRTFALPGTQLDSDLPVSARMAAGDEEESMPMEGEDEGSPSSSDDDHNEESAPVHDQDEETDQDGCGKSIANAAPTKLPTIETSDLLDFADEIGEHGSVSFDMGLLQRRLQRMKAADQSASSTTQSLSASGDEELLQGAGVENQDEAQVERALSRVIHKQDFAAMQVLGQFNLGFIIARRRAIPNDGTSDEMDDLFIVDQHASDEKYNFETLQLTTQIRSQKLIVPRSLELSASDELVAIEHQDTLLANGFEISVSESGLPGTRVKLVAQPISKGTVFGVKDLEELLYLLRDTSAGSEAAKGIRCSKARSMFASRACRKSVMIGTALKKHKMEGILRNMGTIEQPWNCPHGRPTMRHLACLKTIGEAASSADRRKEMEEDVKWDEVVRCLS